MVIRKPFGFKKCKEAWNKTHKAGRENRKAWKKKSLRAIAGL